MTIQDVADLLGVSKKKVWTAVKSGQLDAVKTKRGKAWRYSISEDAAEAYRLSLEGSGEWEPVKERLETGSETRNVSQEPETQRNETATKQGEPIGNDTIKELFDRLEQSHRRQIYLEMQLQQSQHLLCEVNEDQHEREARAKEAEAKAHDVSAQLNEAEGRMEMAQMEAAQAKIELESLKTEMEAKEREWSEARKPWWKKMFGRSAS